MDEARRQPRGAPTSRRAVLGVAAGATAGLAASALGRSTASASAFEPVSAVPAGRQPGADDRADRPLAGRVAELAGAMTLEQKVGQLIVSYVYGETASSTNPDYIKANQGLYGVDTAAEAVATYHLGGVIYFSWTGSLADPTQIATLGNGLQRAALADTGVPLVISTDEEGGVVTRAPAPFVTSPGNMALGATGQPTDARTAATIMGAQLAAMGINLDDAPVVDVNTNPANTADGARSFGDDPAAVAAYAAAAVQGFHDAGVGDSVKHFPGLGSTSVNTDNGIAVTDQTRPVFMRVDVAPFRAAIAAGADTIMAAHIVAPSLDPSGRPASLSKPIVTNLLRHQLRYNGLVITDALNAAALNAYDPVDRVVMAIEAGVDQALMPTDVPGAVDALVAAVHSGRLSEARIDESVTRILTMKMRRGMFDNAIVDTGKAASLVGTAAQAATMKAIAARTITLVKNTGGLLPLAAGSRAKVLVTGWGLTSTRVLSDAVGTHGVTPQQFYAGTSPSAAVIALIVAAAKTSDATVVITSNAWGNTAQQNLVKALVATGKPVIPVSVGGPYDIAYYDSAAAFVAASSYSALSLQAAADTIFGAKPVGRLPVDVPVAGDPSTVLYRRGTGLTY